MNETAGISCPECDCSLLVSLLVSGSVLFYITLWYVVEYVRTRRKESRRLKKYLPTSYYQADSFYKNLYETRGWILLTEPIDARMIAALSNQAKRRLECPHKAHPISEIQAAVLNELSLCRTPVALDAIVSRYGSDPEASFSELVNPLVGEAYWTVHSPPEPGVHSLD